MFSQLEEHIIERVQYHLLPKISDLMESTDDNHGDLLLPGDVLIQILVWLPVISLLRFKSVCKSWRSLIESSFFIHLHAATSSSSSSNRFGTFIFQTSPLCDTSYTTETRIVMITPSRRRRRRRRSGGGGGGEVFEVEDLGVPPLYKTGPMRWRMVGSCNGLICSKLKRAVSLWNPATRQFRLLPKSSLTLEERGWSHVRDVFGFGFDVKTKDYKVVQITSFSLHRKKEFRVQVYSLSTNSWRVLAEDIMISLFPIQQPFKKLNMSIHGLYLNGSFFFKGSYLTENGMSPWVFSFDFTNEIFTPMKQFPDALSSTLILILTYFGADKIAFSSGGGGGEGDFVYDIWVLNNEHDQEEEESYYWTKLQHSIQRSTGFSSWNIPRAISNDGKFALIETRGISSNGANYSKLQLFNLVTKEEKTVFSSGTGILRASVYKPSLVSVIGGGNGNGTAASAADNRVVIGGAI